MLHLSCGTSFLLLFVFLISLVHHHRPALLRRLGPLKQLNNFFALKEREERTKKRGSQTEFVIEPQVYRVMPMSIALGINLCSYRRNGHSGKLIKRRRKNTITFILCPAVTKRFSSLRRPQFTSRRESWLVEEILRNSCARKTEV